MTELEHVEQHEGPTMRDYMIIFIALTVATTVSFITNAILGLGSIPGFIIIMAVSVIKATLVCMFFMHLKWDWGKIYFLMIPVMIVTVMMIIVLLPDTVLSRLTEMGPPNNPHVVVHEGER